MTRDIKNTSLRREDAKHSEDQVALTVSVSLFLTLCPLASTAPLLLQQFNSSPGSISSSVPLYWLFPLVNTSLNLHFNVVIYQMLLTLIPQPSSGLSPLRPVRFPPPQRTQGVIELPGPH